MKKLNSFQTFKLATVLLGLVSLAFGTNIIAIIIRYYISKKWFKDEMTNTQASILAVKAFGIHIAISFVLFMILFTLFPETADLF